MVEYQDKLYFYYGGWNVGHGLFPQGEEAIGFHLQNARLYAFQVKS